MKRCPKCRKLSLKICGDRLECQTYSCSYSKAFDMDMEDKYRETGQGILDIINF